MVIVPLGVALTSPLLAYRSAVYALAGFAGVFAMTLLLIQPLLVGGYLPGIGKLRGRRLHRWCGLALLVSVITHVVGLWVTSPPDVIDALLFRSPTPFSAWGVIAMWAVFGAALLALIRKQRYLSIARWRFVHGALALLVVVSSVVHALLIEGTMGTLSKVMLCAVALLVTLWTMIDLRVWSIRLFNRSKI